jgi:hypothetical protein
VWAKLFERYAWRLGEFLERGESDGACAWQLAGDRRIEALAKARARFKDCFDLHPGSDDGGAPAGTGQRSRGCVQLEQVLEHYPDMARQGGPAWLSAQSAISVS